MKYVAEFVKYFNTPKFPVFTKADAYLFLEQLGATEGYTKRFLGNLAKGGRIRRVKRNYYTCHSNPYVVGFAFSPFYYGLSTALGMYGISEQQSQPVVITATTAIPRTLIFNGKKVFIRRIDEKMFFGVSTAMVDLFEVPVSDVEKTLIDMVYFRYKTEDYAYERLVKMCDSRRLDRYSRSYAQKFRKSVAKLVTKYKTTA